MSGIFVNVGSLSRYGGRNGSLSRRLTGLNPLARATWLLFNNAGVLSPLVTATRSGTATFFDSTGTLQNAAANTPRVSYDAADLSAPPFLLAEEARTNSIRNNTMQGAVAGVPGTLPMNWDANAAGLVLSVVSTQVVNGVPTLRVRANGVASGTIQSIRFESSTTQVAAVQGQSWCTSAFLSFIENPQPPNSVRFSLREGAAGGAFLASPNGPSLPVGTTSARYPWTITTTSATVAFVRPEIQFLLTVGVSYDFTIDIGLPQLELGATASSPILTYGTAVTRSADNLSVTNLAATGFNATEGTIYCAWARDSASGVATGGAASVPRIWALGTASAGLMQLRPFSANSLEFVGSPNGSSLYVASSPWSQSGINKTGCAYAVDNCAAVTNSGVVGTDATVGSFSGLGIDRLAFGANVTGNSPLQGRIYQAAIIPQRVSDSGLQRMTRI